MGIKGVPLYWTEERRNELARLLDLGWSVERIAKKLGRTKHSICGTTHRYRMRSRENYVRVQSENMKRVAATQEHRARFLAAQAKRAEDNRGFPVPEDMWDDYQFMRRKMRSATEAGRVLGLIEGQP